MKTLEDYAKQVWMLNTLEDKKLIAIEMVNQFDFKRKAPMFIAGIKNARSSSEIDKMVSNITLAGFGLKIK